MLHWPWLHYVENGDKVFCYICTKAYNVKKLSASNVESAYITNGYTNWKNAINNFNQHERSKFHADSVLKVVTVARFMKDAGQCLSSVSTCEGEIKKTTAVHENIAEHCIPCSSGSSLKRRWQ